MASKLIFKDKRSTSYRWLVLFLVCLSALGDFYCIDIPGALHDDIKKRFTSIESAVFEFYFNMFYSMYSLPNIVIPCICGVFMTLYGIRLTYVIISLFLIIGQTIFTLGFMTSGIYTMLLGRVVFGFGGESLNIVINSMIVKWFYKADLAIPLALALSVSRLGSVLTAIISPILANLLSVSAALWIGVGVCLFSFSATVILVRVDRYFEKLQLKVNSESEQTTEYDDSNMSKLSKLTSNTSIDSSLSSRASNASNESQLEEDEDNLPPLSCSSFKDFNKCFWIIGLVCGTLYGSILPFNNIATGYYKSTHLKEHDDETAKIMAGIYMSIPFLISTILIPLIGCLTNRIGRRAHLIMISSVFGMAFFISLFVSHPYISLILMGVTYSIFASVIWASIALVVIKRLVGLAFGIIICFINLALVISPIIVGKLFSLTETYEPILFYFILLMIVSFFLSLLIIRQDKYLGYTLSKVNKNDTTFDSLINGGIPQFDTKDNDETMNSFKGSEREEERVEMKLSH